MTTKTESQYELATPIIFGTALGAVIGVFLGPAGAIGAFAVGAGLGFWFDKRENLHRKSGGNASIGQPEKSSHN